MGYSNGYGQRFPANFPAQQAAVGFYGAPGQMTQTQAQNAPAGFYGQNSGIFAVQPVTSREEALAVIADPMSPGVLLPDLGHGVIYVKRFNPNTGISDFGEFRLAPAQPTAAEPQAASPEYVTRPDLETAIAQLKSELTAKGGRAKKEAAADE